MTEKSLVLAMQWLCSIFMQSKIRLVLIHVLALSEVVKMNLSKNGLSHRMISLDEKEF